LKKIALLGLVALAACSSQFAPRSGEPATESGSPDGEGPLAVATDPTTGAATHVEGNTRASIGGAADRTATAATVEFVAARRDLFKLIDPARELKVRRIEKDELAMTHVRMQQMVGDVPVFGGELTAHYAKSGALVTVDAHLVPAASKVDVTPEKTSLVALAAAHDAIRAERPAFDPSSVQAGGASPELMVHVPGENKAPVLVWRVETRADVDGEPMRMISLVDAKTGQVGDAHDDLQTIAASGAGSLGDLKQFEVTQNGGAYSMIDTLRTPNGIRTATAQNRQQIPGTTVTSTSVTTWTNRAAVDAHAHASIVYDYFKTAHGRLGIDGANGAMLSNVNFGTNYNNAFWDGTQMTYGDGDGTTFRAFSASLDVVAHELTHGVTERTSGLIYRNQSGAMNESVSDIFGAFVDHYAKPNPATEWIMGENIALGTRGRRDMKNPQNGQQPGHMSQLVNTTQDNGGVHINSGIPNNAAYLMTAGGTNVVSNINVPAGIGFEKAAKVWYRANAQYFQANTNIAQAAAGTLSAGRDLQLTQRELDIIECAWIATGVVQGQCKTITPQPSPTPGADAGAPGTGSAGSAGTPGTGTAGGATGPDGTPASPGSTGNPGGTGNGADSTEEGDDETPTSRSKKKERALLGGSSAGCQAGPGGVEQADVMALVVGALALARFRRRRSAE